MRKPNIVLVVLDSVPASKVSSYGYHRETTPTFDDFADGGVLYEDAFANGSWTVPTHATLFSGLYPSEHGSDGLARHLTLSSEQTLAGRLTREGYRSIGYSANPWITPEFGYDRGFDEFAGKREMRALFGDTAHPIEVARTDPESGQGQGRLRWITSGNPAKRALNLLEYRRESSATADVDDLQLTHRDWRKYPEVLRWMLTENRLDRVLGLLGHQFGGHIPLYVDGEVVNLHVDRWLDRNAGDTDPFFLFVNFMDAHEPYEPSDEYRTEFRKEACDVDIDWHLRSIDREFTDGEVACVNDLYDADLRYLDDQLAALLNSLEHHGVADDTLVLVTADHGKCLGEHGYMGIGTYLHDEIVRVPMAIATPAGRESQDRPSRLEGPVSHVDIHATILGEAGLESERGQNLLDPDESTDEGRRYAYSETLGPHQDVEPETVGLPAKGLRRLDHAGYTLKRDVASGDGRVDGPADSTQETIEDLEAMLEELESEILDDLDQLSEAGGDHDMSEGTREQLEKLGYL